MGSHIGPMSLAPWVLFIYIVPTSLARLWLITLGVPRAQFLCPAAGLGVSSPPKQIKERMELLGELLRQRLGGVVLSVAWSSLSSGLVSCVSSGPHPSLVTQKPWIAAQHTGLEQALRVSENQQFRQ